MKGTLWLVITFGACVAAASDCKQEYCMWNRGEPSNHGGEEEVLVIAKDTTFYGRSVEGWNEYGWVDVPDSGWWSMKWYLCQFPATNATQSSTNWTYSVYLNPTGSISQGDASNKCQALGGYLGTVTSEADEVMLGVAINQTVNHPGGHEGWIITGGHAEWVEVRDGATHGSWVWKYGPEAVVGNTIWSGRYDDRSDYYGEQDSGFALILIVTSVIGLIIMCIVISVLYCTTIRGSDNTRQVPGIVVVQDVTEAVRNRAKFCSILLISGAIYLMCLCFTGFMIIGFAAYSHLFVGTLCLVVGIILFVHTTSNDAVHQSRCCCLPTTVFGCSMKGLSILNIVQSSMCLLLTVSITFHPKLTPRVWAACALPGTLLCVVASSVLLSTLGGLQLAVTETMSSENIEATSPVYATETLEETVPRENSTTELVFVK